VIIGFAGAGAQHTTIGKEISIVLGEPGPGDGQSIKGRLAETKRALQGLGAALDPQVKMMAEFQLNLLEGELTKAGAGSQPSANTITQVGDWLLDNVPQLGGALQRLFATPAVGRALAGSGDEAVAWLRDRFGGGA
jgi:hypothetical protein